MKPSLNRTTIFILILHGMELYVSFEERENKQKNAKFQLNNLELSFFSHEIALHNVYKHKCLVTMFTNKPFYERFQCFPEWFVYFWMTFCKNSIRISCQIIFVNKNWPQL